MYPSVFILLMLLKGQESYLEILGRDSALILSSPIAVYLFYYLSFWFTYSGGHSKLYTAPDASFYCQSWFFLCVCKDCTWARHSRRFLHQMHSNPQTHLFFSFGAFYRLFSKENCFRFGAFTLAVAPTKCRGAFSKSCPLNMYDASS